MRVLVAGGAGFLGGHVCHELIDRGHRSTCLDNLLTGSMDNIADLDGRPGFDFILSDVATAPTVDADFILHLASPASPVDYERVPLETLAVNSIGTWRPARHRPRDRGEATFTSTSEIYGDPLVHPQPETLLGQRGPVGPRA